MSSIAYLTDEDMLQFHRSQGNREIVFWRLNTKGFERFETGDLLFFVDKRHLHPATGEKGLIGFGKLKNIRLLSVQRTWNDYGKLTGFHSAHRFENKVLEMNHDEMPQWIQSLFLEEVIFFKAPVFLSEVSEKLNRNLESFTYLDDEEVLGLLNKASEQGVDDWFSMMQEKTLDFSFAEIKREMSIRQVLREVRFPWTQEQKRMMTHRKAHSVSNFCYYEEGNQLVIEMPVSSLRNQYYSILGIVLEIQKRLDEDLKFKLLINREQGKYEKRLKYFDMITLEYI